MSFRKFKAGEIFTGTEVLSGNKVLVTDESGVIHEIIDQEDAGDNVEQLAGILSPGFVNCHCHLELSHMRGLIPQKTGLIDFVFKVVTQRHFAEQDIAIAIERAEVEMITNGIVAVGDISNNSSTLEQKRKGNLAYYNFIEASGWMPDLALPRYERSKGYYDEFEKFFKAVSIVPHAPYSVSDELWCRITPYFQNKVVSIHNQEASCEDELFLQGKGDFVRMYEMMNINNAFFKPSNKSSLQTYFDKLKRASSVILVHNTFIGAEDIRYAREIATINSQLLSFCVCVKANLYIEDVLPPIYGLNSSGCNLVLGTDSLASNYSLNLIDEMQVIQDNFSEISLEDMLKWGTLNGAKALQMEDKLGSFDKGKQPGVLLIEGAKDGKINKQTSVRRIL